MEIGRAHFEFQLRLNKIHTFGNPNFFDYQIDAYLDRAQLDVVEAFYTMNQQAPQSGFEVSPQSISAIANLHIKSPAVQSVLSPTEYQTGLYELNLGNLDYDIIFPTKVIVYAEKDNCQKQISMKLWQTDDTKNRINQPSWNYGKIHGNYGKSISGTSLPMFTSVYLDTLNVKGNKEFDVVGVGVSYIKRPMYPWLGTYDLTTDLQTLTPANAIYEAGVDAPVGFELEEFFHNKIIDIAVNLAANDLRKMTAPPQQQGG